MIKTYKKKSKRNHKKKRITRRRRMKQKGSGDIEKDIKKDIQNGIIKEYDMKHFITSNAVNEYDKLYKIINDVENNSDKKPREFYYRLGIILAYFLVHNEKYYKGDDKSQFDGFIKIKADKENIVKELIKHYLYGIDNKNDEYRPNLKQNMEFIMEHKNSLVYDLDYDNNDVLFLNRIDWELIPDYINAKVIFFEMK